MESKARWTLAATILGSLMAFVDGTVVNVALPVIQSDLHATINDAQWIVNAYLLALSSLILVGGSLGDRLGLVRVFGAGVVIFTAGSIACGLAPAIVSLVIARAVQGIGAALLVPGSLAIIAAVFPADQRGKAIGTWSAFTSVAIIIGPLLGGALVQAISWRAVFFINVPIGAVVLWLLMRHVPSIAGDATGHVDWLGALLVSASLGAITWALIEANSHDRWLIAGMIVFGLACAAVLIVVERRAEKPLIPTELFRSRSFTGANILTVLLYAALGGVMFLLPFEWIQIRHYTPAGAGAAFLPIVGIMTVLSPISGRLADRLGSRPFLIIGPIVAGAGFAILAFLEGRASYWFAFAPGLVILGIGMGLTVAPLTTTVMTSIDEERHAGAASGVNNAVARVGGLFATAVFGAIAVAIFSPELGRCLAAAKAPITVRQHMRAQRLQLASAAPPRHADTRTREIVDGCVRIAFHKALRIDLLFGAGLAIASAAGAAVIKPGKRSGVNA